MTSESEEGLFYVTTVTSSSVTTSESLYKCSFCDGKGKVYIIKEESLVEKSCPVCSGTGKIIPPCQPVIPYIPIFPCIPYIPVYPTTTIITYQ